MRALPHLFEKNRQWAARMTQESPGFFEALAQQQAPELLWIGCSDSRVPANEIIGLLPGDVFVHRNVANLVVHSDLNCLAVIQYAVEVLKIRHIIVCGHYGCGGVRAALETRSHGMIDNWLGHIRDTALRHYGELAAISDESTRVDRLCELNVLEQVRNVGHTTVVQDAWRRGEPVFVHGWIYGISSGLLQDLGCCIGSADELAALELPGLASGLPRL